MEKFFLSTAATQHITTYIHKGWLYTVGMTTHNCDSCNKTLKDRRFLTVGYIYTGVELCPECARPVILFLQQHNLLKQARLGHLQISEEVTTQ